MTSKKNLFLTIFVVITLVIAFFAVGAPFIAMHDLIGHEMRKNNPGASFPEPTYLKQDPRDTESLWDAFWPGSDDANDFAGASAEVQGNPYLQ